MKSVLFVCSTNISLSPLLKGIAEQHARERNVLHKYRFESAGSHAGKTPRKVDRRAINCAKENGLILPETFSRQATIEDVVEFDSILAMNEENFWFLRDLAPPEILDNNILPKLKLFMELSGHYLYREVPDPLLDEISYQEVFELLSSVAETMLDN